MTGTMIGVGADGKSFGLQVLNGGKSGEPGASRTGGGALHSGRGDVTNKSNELPKVMRLGDLIDDGKCLHVCCGTCGHEERVDPSDVPDLRELPVAEVRRMLSCTSCGSRWIDARPVAARLPGKIAYLNRRR